MTNSNISVILVKHFTLQRGLMFEKNLKLAYLIDFYGEVLDTHTQRIMNAYYGDDLSLSEIAAVEGISRQGVRHVIKKGEDELWFLEERLGLAAKHEKLTKLADGIGGVKERLLALGGDYNADAELISAVRELIIK